MMKDTPQGQTGYCPQCEEAGRKLAEKDEALAISLKAYEERCLKYDSAMAEIAELRAGVERLSKPITRDCLIAIMNQRNELEGPRPDLYEFMAEELTRMLKESDNG